MRKFADTQPSTGPAARRAAHRGCRTGAAVAVGALLIASCGGDDDASSSTTPAAETTPASSTQPPPDTTDGGTPTTDATSPTTEPETTEPATATTAPAVGTVMITSEDGNLTLEVGAADAERVNPSVRILDPSEWPPELGDADQLPGVTIYEMEPDGAEFDEPVTVTRRLEVASFGESVATLDVPLVVPFTQEDDGRFVPLDDLEVTRVGSSLYASGTTTHFTPLGTIDLGLDVRYPVPVREAGFVIPEADAEFYMDLATSYEFDDLPLTTGVTDLSDALEPEVVSRRAGGPIELPMFSPIVVEEVTGPSPSQSPEEDAPGLFRLFTASDEVPSSPLFGSDGVEVPQELRVVVNLYLLSEDDAERDRLEEIADALASGACLEWSVVHTPLGPFPSYSQSRLSKVPQLEEGELLFAALYTGPIGPGAQLVDIAEMTWDGDGYVADVGLESYGEVQQALVVSTDGSVPGSGMTDREWFESFMSLPGDLMMLFTGQPLVVDATEGVIFDGEVEFEVYPGP